MLHADGDPVIHPSDAGRRPGGSFCLLTFGPGSHAAFENHLAVRRLDRDAVRVDLGAAAESLLDLAFDLSRLDARLDLYLVGDPLNPLHPPHRTFGAQALKVPLDLAFEGDPIRCEPAP